MRNYLQRFSIYFLMTYGLLLGASGDNIEVVTKVGTATANWLRIETGVRAIGMGGAFVAAGTGLSAIPYNPSGVAFIQKSEAYYSKSNYLAEITHNVLGYGVKLTNQDFLGFHLFYLNSGLMEVNTELSPGGTGEYFNVISLSFRTVYARRLTDRLKVGMSLNYIRDQIYTTMMQTFAFDVGSNFNTGIYGFTLGMSISNFGPEVQYHGEGLQIVVPDTIDVDERTSRVTEKFPLPLVFRLGIKNDIIGPESEFIKNKSHRLSVAADGVNPIDYTVMGHVGIEYSYFEFAFLRTGIHLGHNTAGITGGGGLKIRAIGMNILVDYAYVDYGILKMTHQVGLSLEF
ncbi:MAG: PorV/PorQ family protein [Candidatus Neomarinimicrobiota bacterium]|nr:PorV/PorQ family protein [Candidatus Neomarinimicrobiota bacterium]